MPGWDQSRLYLALHSIEDRDYYVDDDPVHKAFKDAAAAVVEKAVVIDD